MKFTFGARDGKSPMGGEVRHSYALWCPFQQQGIRSTLLNPAVNLLWRVGTALAVFAPLYDLICLGPMRRDSPAGGPVIEGPPDSGVVVRTEVTAVWIPQALCELARGRAGPRVDCSPEEVQIYLARHGWRVAWYALTCRGYQVNGHSEEITHIRWLSEAAEHLDELQAVMATAAGRSPRFEGSDSSCARVEIIPDTLQAVDSREAITRLMAEQVAGDRNLPTGRSDAPRRID
jgi:hypothetical protein